MEKLEDGAIVIVRRNNGWVTGVIRRNKLTNERVFQDTIDVFGHIYSLADMIRSVFSSELRSTRRGGLDLCVSRGPKK